MSLIYVKATSGLKVPKEGNPRNYITEAEPVPVESSHYYRKALVDGDLVEVSADEVAAFQKKADAAAKSAAKAEARDSAQ